MIFLTNVAEHVIVVMMLVSDMWGFVDKVESRTRADDL